jgi:hypothetical protein
MNEIKQTQPTEETPELIAEPDASEESVAEKPASNVKAWRNQPASFRLP